MRGRIAVAVLAGMLAFGSSVAAAQGDARSNTRNLFLGLSLGGTSLEIEDPDGGFETEREQGGGASLRLGYGFTSLFSLYIEAAGASIDSEGETFGLAHGDIGARFHFGSPSRAFIPFLDVAFTARAIGADDVVIDFGQGPELVDVEISGSGISFGGGFLWFLSPKWALDLGLTWTTGEFDTVKVENVSVSGLEIDGTSARLKLGVSWFPMSAR